MSHSAVFVRWSARNVSWLHVPAGITSTDNGVACSHPVCACSLGKCTQMLHVLGGARTPARTSARRVHAEFHAEYYCIVQRGIGLCINCAADPPKLGRGAGPPFRFNGGRHVVARLLVAAACAFVVKSLSASDMDLHFRAHFTATSMCKSVYA